MKVSALKELEKELEISERDMRAVVGGFHHEMDDGLAGRPGCLKMIPTYADRPTGKEEGRYIALDLGGTNFRILSIRLNGRGASSERHAMKFALREADISSTGKRLFEFLAGAVKKFIDRKRIARSKHIDLGFTFSFPVKQTGIASGTLVTWTKGFSASGVKGHDVVHLLNRALEEEGVYNVSVAALANDTVGTLVARSYGDKDCDVGVIIGTGTNACYVEALRKITKFKGKYPEYGTMIINTEWGNFNRIKTTRYDRQLDRESGNPGAQILEKMVSGMYIGEIARLIMKDFISKKALFTETAPAELDGKMFFRGEFVSQVLADRSRTLAGVEKLLKLSDAADDPSFKDKETVRKICELVARRAARISAAAITAVVTKIDPSLKRNHTVAIDGSVYEKLPGFSGWMEEAIRELSGRSSGKIKLMLTKDGSGYGAAIIAAVATRKEAL